VDWFFCKENDISLSKTAFWGCGSKSEKKPIWPKGALISTECLSTESSKKT